MHTVLHSLFAGKRVLQIGLGVQGGGLGMARYIAPVAKRLVITDKKSENELAPSVKALQSYPAITLALGGHKSALFSDCDLIVIGPSVPWNLPELERARARGTPVVSEIELFFQAAHTPIIGVTGTRGKTTTASMIYGLLHDAEKKVALGGNVPGQSTIELLEQEAAVDFFVLELSSWQLAGLHRIKKSPHIGVFTSFFPDHLNFYSSMEDYWFDKSALYRYQHSSDILIAHESLEERIIAQRPQSQLHLVSSYIGPLRIMGSHNRHNAALAQEVGRILGISSDRIAQSLSAFAGVHYRLERVASIKGVDVYNDTTSTTPIALQYAIRAMKEKYQHVVLIMGGNSKRLPYDELLEEIAARVDKIILLKGTFTDQLQSLLPRKKLVGAVYDDLSKAVAIALDETKRGGCLLFSPGATSFAMFKNEFDRGAQFNAIIKEYA